MDLLAVLGVYTLILVSTTLGSELDRCPAGVTRSKFLKTYNDHCYQFNHYQVRWQQAQNNCRRNGGHLVVIKNAETQNFLMSSLRSLGWRRNGVWIGANDLRSEMRWEWVTGESIGYAYWGSGQPSCKIFRCREDCGILRYSDGGRWHDKPCDDSFYIYSFICQYDMIPTTTTSTTVTTTAVTTVTVTTASTSGTNSTQEIKIVQEDLLKKEAGKSLNKVQGKTSMTTTSTTAKITTTSDKQKYSVVNDPGQQKQHIEDSPEHATGTGTIIALALGVLLGLTVGICFGAFCFIRRRKKKQQHASASFINPYYEGITPVDDDTDRCVVEYKDDVQVGPSVQYDTLPSLSLNNPIYGEAVTVRPSPSDSYDLPKPTPCGLPPRDIYQNSNPYENTLPVEENFYEDIDTIKAAIAMNESLDKEEEEDRYVSMPTRNVM